MLILYYYTFLLVEEMEKQVYIHTIHTAAELDFLAQPQSFVFEGSPFERITEEDQCFLLTGLDDSLVEGTEMFSLEIITDDPAVRFTTPSATVSILDNEGDT